MSQNSYAHSRKDLPGARQILKQAGQSRTPFEQARQDGQSQGSQMVQRSAPTPQPRPSPELAQGADRKAFNDNWERERRRTAFIADRVQAARQRRTKDRLRQ